MAYIIVSIKSTMEHW